MNIRNLETFYWIARLGTFAAAADRVFTTQSAVSMRIRELEQSLGVALFDRSHRTAQLTPKGKELVFYAERLIELTTEMQQRITPSESMSGLIRVGVIDIIAFTWLPRFIHTLRDSHPNIKLELEIALTAELVNKLTHGTLDVIFALGRPPYGNYIGRSLGSIQLEWMANPVLGISRETVVPRELEHWPFITLNHFSYHHAMVEDWMKRNQIRCRKVIVCNSMGVAASLIAAGVGIGLLPPICYSREIEMGALQIVRTTGPMRPVELAAMYSAGEFQPFGMLIAELAVQVSTKDLKVDVDDRGTIAPLQRPPNLRAVRRSR